MNSTASKRRDINYAALADAFMADHFKDAVFYRGRNYAYDGTKYVEIEYLAHRVRRWLINKKKAHSNAIVGNVVPAFESQNIIDSQRYPSMSFWKGTEPFAQNIIAYKNGLLDLDSRTLHKHDADWVSASCLPFDYDSTATCPKWENFLAEIFGDPEKIALLQEWFGYCLTPDMSHHKALIKHGPPRSGKTTIDNILRALLGDSACAYSLRCLSQRFGLAPLLNKQVAIVDEVDLHGTDKFSILETFKSIVGGGQATIEAKHKDRFDTTLFVKFNISCNELPTFCDDSGALAVRLLILDFTQSFLGREDRSLTDKLLTELPGINNWALEGLGRLRTNKVFTELAGAAANQNAIRRDNSDIFAFVQDCLIVEKRYDNGALQGFHFTEGPLSVERPKLLDVCDRWANETGRTINRSFLERDLRKLLDKLPIVRKMRDGVRIRVYEGIGVAQHCPASPDNAG